MIRGRGGFLGPDLTDIGALRTVPQLRESLLKPSARIADGYEGVTVTMRDGSKISGVARNANNYSMQILQKNGALRLLAMDDVREVEFRKSSLMPEDFGKRLPAADIANVLAFLSRQSVRPPGQRGADESDVLTVVLFQRIERGHTGIRRVWNVFKAQPLITRGSDRHPAVLRIQGSRRQDAQRLRFAIRANCHEARLRDRGGPVVQRSIRDLHAREARHHRLVFVNELQRALTRLGLIGSVGAVELAPSREGPDCGRDVVLVRARADETQRPPISPRPFAHQPSDLHLVEPNGHPRPATSL